MILDKSFVKQMTSRIEALENVIVNPGSKADQIWNFLIQVFASVPLYKGVNLEDAETNYCRIHNTTKAEAVREIQRQIRDAQSSKIK